MIGYFLTAIPLGGIFGGPAASYLLGLNGLGLAGWQWLFIVEGLPAALLAPVVLFYLQDRPDQAAWLPGEERDWLVSKLAGEKRAIEVRSSRSVLRALTSPTVLLMALMYFSNVCLLNGITFFLPQIVKGLGVSIAMVGYIVAVPSILALFGVIYWGRRSDRKQERFGHVAFANFLAAAALLVAMTLHDPIIRGVAISIAFASTLCMVVPFWTIPGTYLSGTQAAGAIAAVSAVGVTGGFVAPFFVGYMKDLTGDFKTGFLVIAVFGMAISLLFYAVGSRQQQARNRSSLLADTKAEAR